MARAGENITGHSIDTEVTSTPNLLHISDDIDFHLPAGLESTSFPPGSTLTMDYQTANEEEAAAFGRGKVLLKSRFAIGGGRLQSILVTPHTVENGKKTWMIQATVQNVGPISLIMPKEYPLLRWYEHDENPLSGEELLTEARKMGSTKYIKLQSESSGESYTVAQIDSMRAKNQLSPEEIANFGTILLDYSIENGHLTTKNEIDLATMPGRRERLDNWVGLRWRSPRRRLPEDQRLLLQRTAKPVRIPAGTFGMVQYSGLLPGDLRHGAARGLNPVTNYAEYNWQIYAESGIPQHDLYERTQTNRAPLWNPSGAMRVKLHRTA